jgi:putative ABC transport system substrate-binding protein
MRHVSRRAFVSSLAALAASSILVLKPQSAYAQQQPAAPRRIGFLAEGGISPAEKLAFRQGLREAGYTEGRDVVIEWRYAAGGDEVAVTALAADLVKSRVDVIIVVSTLSTQVVKRATPTIPIVMTAIGDPVGSGLVKSLAHPGGNVTGLTIMMTDLSARRLQLLREAIPRLTRVAVLWNPGNSSHPLVIEELKAAAPSLSIELRFVSARTPEELRPAFLDVRRTRTQALYVIDDAFFFGHGKTISKLALEFRLPVIYGESSYPAAGALMSYGPSTENIFLRSAGYVDKILKGAKPADLPIQQPNKFELVINLKTAKALGITIPQSILLQANEVIR